MAFFKIILACTVLTISVLAAPQNLAQQSIDQEEHHHNPVHYEFKYGVRDEHTHDIKEQHEKRDGERVEGYYMLLEPDDTTRTVKYSADHKSGFNAVVIKSGHAKHPEVATKLSPVHHVAVHTIPVQSVSVPSISAVSEEPANSAPSKGQATSFTSIGFGQ